MLPERSSMAHTATTGAATMRLSRQGEGSRSGRVWQVVIDGSSLAPSPTMGQSKCRLMRDTTPSR